MAISKEKLSAIIGGRAQQLCSPESDRKLNELAGRMNMDNPDPASYNDNWDSLYLNEDKSSVNPNDIAYNEYSASNSNMPDAIKKSMLQERIDVSALGNISVLDSLNVKPQRKQQQRRQMTEQSNTMQYHQQPQQNTGIDYSIIKAIVNECLSEYFTKQQINESTSLKTIGLKGGNITLVDNSGNVYQAKLQKIKNK